ncbi:unnamed protein product [Periconia digitata]|uniref:SGNH hydrolase-type esterase domain-containing protein n=1 Tax=Periconia digitata TaxID=1303443 RepID=A0A9W4UBK9_9PLEO|nr:unnamed protein product [Periconia digitata]
MKLCGAALNDSNQKIQSPQPLPSIVDQFTPGQGDVALQIMGDSYSAGPGAGDLLKDRYHPNYPKKCRQFSMAWGQTLLVNWPFYNRPLHYNRFLPCLGHTTNDFIQHQIPEMSLDNNVAALTLGGNDLGFSSILRRCLLKISVNSCDAAIKDAEKVLKGDGIESLHDRMYKVWNKMFEKMEPDWHNQIYHLGYPTFFNVGSESSDWCDSHGFNVNIINGPKLDKSLRRRMNKLIKDFNDKLQHSIARYNSDHHNPGSPEWGHRRLFFVDPNPEFNGHRFCEDKIKSLRHDDIWIFGTFSRDNDNKLTQSFEDEATNVTAIASGSEFAGLNATHCASDTRYSTDDDFNYLCDYARASHSTKALDPRIQNAVLGLVTRSFHPKSKGMTAYRLAIDKKIRQQRRNSAYDVELGLCSFHMKEEVTCSRSGFQDGKATTTTTRTLNALLTPLLDDDKLRIGGMPDSEQIEEGFAMTSRLKETLVITGHKEGGSYVDFNYGNKHWNTRTEEFPEGNSNGWCSVGGWASVPGTGCGRKGIRDMDCTFHC